VSEPNMCPTVRPARVPDLNEPVILALDPDANMCST
jgi:hypothetical protein